MSISIGDIVKPIRFDGVPWKLGVVEQILPDGRLHVRKYVAPSGSYEGCPHAVQADSVEVVPRDRVMAALGMWRIRLSNSEEVIRQIENALRAHDEAVGGERTS